MSDSHPMIASGRSSRRSFIQMAGWVAVANAVCGCDSASKSANAVDELSSMSATNLAKLIRVREVSSLEVVNAYLERIQKVEPKINAIAQLASESARDLARKADSTAVSEIKKPLHGVPVTFRG